MSEENTYNPKSIERKWQNAWNEKKVFKTECEQEASEPSASAASPNHEVRKPSGGQTRIKPKSYILEQFPYPSGKLHMGHLRVYTIGDLLSRLKKAQGYSVLHPMGWDAFGLPAENAAIENNQHPADWTYKNIENMKRQLDMVGISYDWEKELATCDPEYYKHEQKMFLDLLKAGIAYRKESMVNWDPVDNTVLANEQVIDGKGWRSGAPIERKKLSQWFLRITDFAEDLLKALDELPGWPERVRTMQDRWIGKSTGALIHFEVDSEGLGASLGSRASSATDKGETKLTVYTTRPDTIFGASFVAISPNHPVAEELSNNNPKLKEFIEEFNRLGVSEEAIEKAEKKGVDTGLKINHPFLKNHKLPLYVANFVLMEYGSGAIFGCPAHDERDFAFAKKYNLPIKEVVSSNPSIPGELPHTGDGKLMNSEFLDGLDVEKAKELAIKKLEELKIGERKINFRLRDWGVSRQRYWGCPIPIIYCDSCGAVPVPEKDLPVTLPKDVKFDKPGNPLDHHPTWKKVSCPKCSKPGRRETDTFDTFMESSWYFARFCSPKSEKAFDDNEVNHWLPVDYYVGGIDHAVLHLLYSRFFMRALNKIGYTKIKEPFKALITQGMVCRETYKDKNGKWLYPEDVKKEAGNWVHAKTGEPVTVGRVEKMSKSKKNVVSPEEMIEKYGADSARLFILSDSPPERDLEWTDTGIEGCSRYLSRLWKLVYDVVVSEKSGKKADETKIEKADKVAHKTIKLVTEDLEKNHLNKAVARIREFTNLLMEFKPEELAESLKDQLKVAIRLIYPMTPHLSEELWNKLGEKKMLAETAWPVADENKILEDKVTVAVQLNGKLKGTVELKIDENEEVAKTTALALPSLKSSIEGKEVKKIIVVKNRIVNVVAA